MKNREVYLTDPSKQKLLNQGVADVDAVGEEILRYELSTFVCDGQYGKGMQRILETYLDHLEQPDQPAVWVSGFYGSGKSHLVKILSYLWVNYRFSDGATARDIAHLPDEIRELFVELDNQAKRHGGLHSASGTLKAHDDEGRVRTALLGLVFKSAGLPQKYHLASFVFWLRDEGIYDAVRQKVEETGKSWDKELTRLHISAILRKALVEVRPDLFINEASCSETLRQQFPSGKDVTTDEMLEGVRLALTKDDRFPLTVIVLDEVQQYIGDDPDRSLDVQEVVEACCKNFEGKLLFIATGQTAVTGTPNLKKLQGRFRIPVQLSDMDVDRVIRKVILAKKSEAVDPITKVMNENIGEISRHLSGSSIGHNPEDRNVFYQDYPILPVRRRFWENTLRLLDPSGTESQLRNQLSMVHKAIQSNLDKPVGNVIPADYQYFESAISLQQAHILPRNVYDATMKWIEGTEDEQLMARACGVVFMINKISHENTELGIKADTDTIADLLITNITGKNGDIRGRLPGLLDSCSLLIKVADEYRIQTPESAEWNDEFDRFKSDLVNQSYRIDTEREDRIRSAATSIVNRIDIRQGNTKEPRKIYPEFGSRLPADHNQKVYVWVRNGWETSEDAVRVDARQAGSESPTVFVYIPKRSPDELRKQIITYKAATSTLEVKGKPDTPEGREARAAMETRRQQAEQRISEYIHEAFSGAMVFQGGGTEVSGDELSNAIQKAAENALVRLYPRFQEADHPGWSTVYDKAKKGATDALQAVGHDGQVSDHPVCKTINSFIGAGKKGAEILTNFQNPAFGWPKDAVDGALLVLMNAGIIRAEDDRGREVDVSNLERRDIGKLFFRMETATVTARQRIRIRKLLQELDIKAQSGQESVKIGLFMEKLEELADQAGGDPPKPERPDTSWLESVKHSAGNEQILALHNIADDVEQTINQWQSKADLIQKRWDDWLVLEGLAGHATELDEAKMLVSQVRQIRDHRQLLENPNPVEPLLKKLTDILRKALNERQKRWEETHELGMQQLKEDENWQKLEPEQRNGLLEEQKLTDKHRQVINVATGQEIHQTLNRLSLSGFSDRIDAIPGRINQVALKAAKMLEPEVQEVQLPSRIIRTEDDIEQWLETSRKVLTERIKKGPVAL